MPIERIDFDIYQLKKIPDNHDFLFSSLELLTKYNMKVELNRYEKIYEGSTENTKDIINILDNIYRWSNTTIHPNDYKGHSISVSDIIMINNEYWYCDSFGWEKINIK